MRRDGTLLKRYCAGEFDQVWREIRSHASLEGELRDEVMEVARRVRTRFAALLEGIVERL